MVEDKGRVSFIDNDVLATAHPIARDLYVAVRSLKHEHAMALSDGDVSQREEYHNGAIKALDSVEGYIGEEYL